MIANILIALFALAILCFFSYGDIKAKFIENKATLSFIWFGMIITLFFHSFRSSMLYFAFAAVIAFLLWQYGGIGGADAKVLMAIPFYLGFIGIAQGFTCFIVFMGIFAVLGAIFGIMLKIRKNKVEVPFVPIITFAFILYYVWFFLVYIKII